MLDIEGRTPMSRKTKKARVRQHSPSSSSTTSSTSDDKQEAFAQKTERQKQPELRDVPRPGWLLSLSLSTAVPIEIDNLYQNFRGQAGILPWMVGEAVVFGQVLAERGDRLLFRSERKGETADMFVGLARTLAIMSFVPGGVPFLEEPFDALKQLSSWYGEEEARAFCKIALQPYFDAVINEIPVTCWREGNEPIAFGTYNALRWFERAENEDILGLRAASFQGCATWVLDPYSRSGYEQHLLSHLFDQAQSRVRWSASGGEEEQAMERLGDQLLLAARDESQEISFQVEAKAAEAWLALYKHALLTGERWLLPPEPKQKKKRSSNHRE
jgi:hypothetical protein